MSKDLLEFKTYYLDEGIKIIDGDIYVDGVKYRILEKSAHKRKHLFVYGENGVEVARQCPECKTFKRRNDFPLRHRRSEKLDMCTDCYESTVMTSIRMFGLKDEKGYVAWTEEQDRQAEEKYKYEHDNLVDYHFAAELEDVSISNNLFEDDDEIFDEERDDYDYFLTNDDERGYSD